ncbi:ent-kaurene oxidase [Periconia macrospinosa]|uniref:Ent-kaurene oxidase n=1 Tax=Periconia macrospinosa TaxID=97972 RepID=A0A2V1CYW6_9PLEO|nr:ent-kaurene oxidase [Periconia macrospinosa]
METQLFAIPTYTAQTFVFASVVFAIFACLPVLDYRIKLSKLPVIGVHSSGEKQRQFFLTSAKKIYTDGYRKFKHTVFRIASWDDDDVVIVPPSMLSELRKLPDDVLSFSEATSRVLESKYTGVSGDLSVLAHCVQADLTPALTRMNAEILDEVEIAMERFLPRENSTAVQIYDTLAYIVAQVSGRLFVGPELCRDSDYIDCAVKYSLEIFTAAGAIKKLRPWLRPLLGSRVPEVKLLWDRERRAMDMIGSLIRQRQEAEKADPAWQKPDDMMQWLMARSNESLAKLTNRQLVLTFAAIHTTTTAATNVLYTLAATPEYIPELREEVRGVLAENGGVLTTKALQQMLKLDSYMREVNRYYPIGLITFNRRALKPFTLSNGQRIPAGVTVGAVAFAVYDDPDPNSDVYKFDGFRHYKQRINARAAGAQARTQFVAANEDNMAFGYGRHACPGRFFAANEIKIILARLLLDYDISMPDGLTERHAQLMSGNFCSPDPKKVVVLKRVQV